MAMTADGKCLLCGSSTASTLHLLTACSALQEERKNLLSFLPQSVNVMAESKFAMAFGFAGAALAEAAAPNAAPAGPAVPAAAPSAFAAIFGSLAPNSDVVAAEAPDVGVSNPNPLAHSQIVVSLTLSGSRHEARSRLFLRSIYRKFRGVLNSRPNEA
jgi:hypothetical protein